MITRSLLTAILAVTIGSGSFFTVSAEAGPAKLRFDAPELARADKPKKDQDWNPSGPLNSNPSDPSNSGPSASGKAPEIDPGMARAGLVVLAGGLLMLVDRYRRR